MSFSPTALAMAVSITGSVLGGMITAPDRHYRVAPPHGGFVFNMQAESEKLSISSSPLQPDICEQPRSLDADIRDWSEQHAYSPVRVDDHIHNGVNAEVILTTTIIPTPMPTTQYVRKWTEQCRIPAGEKKIDVLPLDIGLPFGAIPLTKGSDAEISACVNVDTRGRVSQMTFPRPKMMIPEEMIQKIEAVAKKCWRFESENSVSGWIQVGLDSRLESYSL